MLVSCRGFQQKFAQRLDEHWESKRKSAEELLARAATLHMDLACAIRPTVNSMLIAQVQQEEEEKHQERLRRDVSGSP